MAKNSLTKGIKSTSSSSLYSRNSTGLQMESINSRQSETSIRNQKLEDWFGELMGSLEMDKILLKEDIASEETKRTYEILMNENKDDFFEMSRVTSSMYYIEKMIMDYLKELNTARVNLNKLAFDLGNFKLLAWAEINSGDEATEDKLIMAEARINAKYDSSGFHLTTTIIEECDNLAVPSHYNSVI